MNRKAFGQMITNLRQELGWTQVQLAEYAEIDENTLSNIERGVKKHLDPKLLFRLANALNLTSLERREFFLGASGLDLEQVARQPNRSLPIDRDEMKKEIARVVQSLTQVYAPLYISDAFGDMLAINHVCMELMSYDPAQLRLLASNQGHLNMLHFVYGMVSMRESLGDHYDAIILTLIQGFRAASLRYRTQPRYLAIMEEFHDSKRYPLFERHWRKAIMAQGDLNTLSGQHELEHKEHGRMRFISSPNRVHTRFGEIFISQYTPVDRETSQKFIKMADKVGTDVLYLAPWP